MGQVIVFDRRRAEQIARSRSLAAALIDAWGGYWMHCATAWWKYLSGGRV